MLVKLISTLVHVVVSELWRMREKGGEEERKRWKRSFCYRLSQQGTGQVGLLCLTCYLATGLTTKASHRCTHHCKIYFPYFISAIIAHHIHIS